jgi:hypothetical protein
MRPEIFTMAVNKISMGINYRKKTNARMTGSGNYFAVEFNEHG